jgi:hypothetical protein
MFPWYMNSGIPQNPQKKFECKKCNYTTSHLGDFNKHLTTRKHVSKHQKMFPKSGSFAKKNPQIAIKICDCGREFKTRGGLWKHKKKCIDVVSRENVSKKNDVSKNVSKIPKKSKVKKKESMDEELKKLQLEELKLKNEKLKKEIEQLENPNYQSQTMNNLEKIIPALEILAEKAGDTTNSHNTNNISLNVYLNENCKNALNLKDFVNQIKISLEDLEYSGENGLSLGIGKALTNALEDLQPTERPIHCSDQKRQTFYVKDDNTWKKDINNEKIDKSIQNIQFKHVQALAEWNENHRDWPDNPELKSQKDKLSCVYGPQDVKKKKKFNNKIKAQLGGHVDITTVLKEASCLKE